MSCNETNAVVNVEFNYSQEEFDAAVATTQHNGVSVVAPKSFFAIFQANETLKKTAEVAEIGVAIGAPRAAAAAILLLGIQIGQALKAKE